MEIERGMESEKDWNIDEEIDRQGDSNAEDGFKSTTKYIIIVTEDQEDDSSNQCFPSTQYV